MSSSKFGSNFTLWCGNLSPNVDEELLFELFMQAGPVQKTIIPREKNGISKGYGFVIFSHEVSVVYAMELLKGTMLFGKRIILKQRVNSDSYPNRHRRASLQDHLIHPNITYQTTAHHQYASSSSDGFEGYSIPVLSTPVQQPYYEYPQMIPSMGVNMAEPNSPTHFHMHNRRRTHAGGPLNYENYFSGSNYQNYSDGRNYQSYSDGRNYQNYSDGRNDQNYPNGRNYEYYSVDRNYQNYYDGRYHQNYDYNDRGDFHSYS